MFGRRKQAEVAGGAARGGGKVAGKAVRGAGKAAGGGGKVLLKSGKARKVARGAGKAALKGGARAITPKEPATTRFLKYGFFIIAGIVVGALLGRSREERELSSSFTGGTGPHAPDPNSPAGQRGETWGSGTPLGTAGGGGAGGVTDVGTVPSQHQRPEEPNRTGVEREYSDPSSGPLIGRQHRSVVGDIPEQQQEVEQRIRTRVGEDPRTSDLPRLNVEVNDGVVDLRGEVHSEEEKQAVEEIASDTEGVAEVRNLLTVNPDAPSRRGEGTGHGT